MGEGESDRKALPESQGDQRGKALTTLRLVVNDDCAPCDPRFIEVRGVRRSLGRLLRALPVADWNASAFPDVVVTQLAQYDSVTAAYLWGNACVEAVQVDDAIAGMQAIERWVRGSLGGDAAAEVRKQELQVFIPDEELRSPLVLSEWSGAFVQDAPSLISEEGDLELALAGLSSKRLLVIARRLGAVSPVDWSRSTEERRVVLESAIARTLRDAARLGVLVSTLPDAARGLLSQLAGGCCDERCLQRWAQFYIGEGPLGVEGGEEIGGGLGHPVQLLRDCGLVFLDSACRLAVPESLVAALRVALDHLHALERCSRAAH